MIRKLLILDELELERPNLCRHPPITPSAGMASRAFSNFRLCMCDSLEKENGVQAVLPEGRKVTEMEYFSTCAAGYAETTPVVWVAMISKDLLPGLEKRARNGVTLLQLREEDFHQVCCSLRIHVPLAGNDA